MTGLCRVSFNGRGLAPHRADLRHDARRDPGAGRLGGGGAARGDGSLGRTGRRCGVLDRLGLQDAAQFRIDDDGLAVKLPKRTCDRTIFSFGHFPLANRWLAITDNEGTGHPILRRVEHDSERLRPGSPAMKGHEPMDWQAFEAPWRKGSASWTRLR
ncbi:hypothetical protein [Jannaschia rubra]|uniref:hypothetical protein n=1 Tax=Jannaschia rubra TaxID=282197 RepID=UPI0006E2EB71|nr:hypothetical protein [Jannaschia rubra]